VQDASKNIPKRQHDTVLITGEMEPANIADTLIDHTVSNAVQNASKIPHTDGKSPIDKENTGKYGLFHFLISCIKLLYTIFSHFHHITASVILILAIWTITAKSSTVPSSEIQMGIPQMNISTLLGVQNPNASITFYPTSSMEITTFEHMLGEIKQEMFYGNTTNCHSSQVSNDLCEKDKSNCQLTRTNIDNAKNAIDLHMNTLFTMEDAYVIID
jgi:hypothetical protein